MSDYRPPQENSPYPDDGQVYPSSNQQPQVPGTPPGTPPQQPGEVEAKPSRLGLIAMITAIVGFIFGVIPGAFVIGWVLLPVAFVLSLVAMFKPGKKTQATVALILSIVGTIVSVIVFVAVLGKVVDDAFTEAGFNSSSEAELVETDSDGAVETDQEADEADSEAGTPEGTRENPFAIGDVVTDGDWTIVVNSVERDATDEVVAASPANEAPEAGEEYLLVNLTATYVGDEKGNTMEVTVAFVDDGGEVYRISDAFVVAPDPSFGLDELYTDASATGNTVFVIPDGAEGLIRISPGLFADDFFVSFD